MFALLLAAATAAITDADLTFLSGDWRQCTSDGFVEERWLGPREGLAVGANLTLRKGKAMFEHLRIQREADGWTYWASPAGKPPVPFKLVEGDANHAVFANPEHGFPARITYMRDGNELLAKIDGTISGKPREESWRFTAGTAADCGKR
ncbi:DUF6265 family protein [Roseiterribacter gracilis]|uniref:DUF6265 domain-containing protein n=1 Tax=Roseiterribacter gracilis TaxID=2812848 RepID=A0A8S8X8N4_9PROT|nr:hypothetical protein TMPK1_20500 [Rhodospirillales bacterium TMPK1]